MLTPFPVAGKKKSAEICHGFVAGAPHDAEGFVFYGVDDSNYQSWMEAQSGAWWYIDNSYFDEARQSYFRVTRKRLQHSGKGNSDCLRLESLGIGLKPWHDGDHIILCPQSDHFMHKIVRRSGDWTLDTLASLQHLTDRTIVIRPWSADKGRLAVTLAADLEEAYALVTWSSAAAVTAAINGVRSVSMGQSAAVTVGGRLYDIENLPTPERKQWAGVLADNQFTLEEMRKGIAWQMLQG